MCVPRGVCARHGVLAGAYDSEETSFQVSRTTQSPTPCVFEGQQGNQGCPHKICSLRSGGRGSGVAHSIYIYTHTIYLLSSLRHVPLQVKSMKPVKSSPKKRNVPSPDTAKSTKRCKAARPQSGVHMFGMVWEHRAAQN